MLLKGGLVFDGIHEEPRYVDVQIKDGKIVAMGRDLSDDEVIDVSGQYLYPGLVEAHCHLGLAGYGIGYEGTDYNELNDICTPQLRAIDSYNPLDPSVRMALESGVTTVGTGQGSANAIGGTWIAVKTVGKCVDDSIVKDPIAMKCALGENPKRVYRDKGNSARMSTAAVIRNMVFKARQYLALKEAAGNDITKLPAFDYKCEAMIPVLKKEIPLKIHAHQANDILTAIRLGKELDVKITLEHVTEGHLIVDELAKYPDIPLAVGPTLTHASKFELQNLSWQTPVALAKRGLPVSIVTDSPFVPQAYLALSASLAIKAGMETFDALKAITINPAKHLGISDRVGSLEVGKDGDVLICNGDIFDIHSCIEHVVVDGKVRV